MSRAGAPKKFLRVGVKNDASKRDDDSESRVLYEGYFSPKRRTADGCEGLRSNSSD